MPIDPGISLQVRPPQVTSPFEAMGQALSIKDLTQRSRMNEIQLQEAQQEQQDQKTVMEAYGRTGGDLFQTMKAVGGKVRPKTLIALHSAAVEQQTKENQMGSTGLKLEADKDAALADLLDGITDPSSAQMAMQTAVQRGLISPQGAQSILSQPWSPDVQASLKQAAALKRSTSQRLTIKAQEQAMQQGAAEDQRKQMLFPGQMAKQAAEVQTAQQAAAGTTPITPYQREELGKGSLHPVTIEDPKTGKPVPAVQEIKRDGGSRILLGGVEVPNATVYHAPNIYSNVQMQSISGGDTVESRLQQVPQDFRDMVKALIEYRRVPVGGFATRDPFWKQAITYAYQVDPDYDEKEFPSRSKMVNSFTSGQDAKEIEAINTVSNHVGTLMEATDALKNGNVQLLNNIANRLKTQIGKTPQTTFETIVRRIGPEITRAYVGTGGEFGERKANEGDFNSSMSPDQIKTNGLITLQLLEGKIDSKATKWKQGMKRSDFSLRPGGPSFISPAAQTMIDKWGPKTQQNTGRDLSNISTEELIKRLTGK